MCERVIESVMILISVLFGWFLNQLSKYIKTKKKLLILRQKHIDIIECSYNFGNSNWDEFNKSNISKDSEIMQKMNEFVKEMYEVSCEVKYNEKNKDIRELLDNFKQELLNWKHYTSQNNVTWHLGNLRDDWLPKFKKFYFGESKKDKKS